MPPVATRGLKRTFADQIKYQGDLVVAASSKVFAPGPPTHAHDVLTRQGGYFDRFLPTATRGWPPVQPEAAQPWCNGHLVGTFLDGTPADPEEKVKRLTAVLRVAHPMPMPMRVAESAAPSKLVLYVRLPRPVASKYNLKACTAEDVMHFELKNADARRLLCNLRIASFASGDVSERTLHHPHTISVLVSMHSLGDLSLESMGRVNELNVPVLNEGAAASDFGNAGITVVCLPPLNEELEKCFALLGHSLAVGTKRLSDNASDDSVALKDGAASDASDDVPIVLKLDHVWSKHPLYAQTAEVGAHFQKCTHDLLNTAAGADVLTKIIPSFSAHSCESIFEDVLARFSGTGATRRSKSANEQPTRARTIRPSPSPLVPATEPAPAPASTAPASAVTGNDSDDSDGWEFHKLVKSSHKGGDDEPSGATPRGDGEGGGRGRGGRGRGGRGRGGGGRGGRGRGAIHSNDDDLDDMRDSELSEVSVSSYDEDESDTSDIGEAYANVDGDGSESDDDTPSPPLPPAVAPPPPSSVSLASTTVVHKTRGVEPGSRELHRLLKACESSLGNQFVALRDKVSDLDDAIASGSSERSTALLSEIATTALVALHQKGGQRACVADCARTCAREAHGRCAATLPVIADALRDVRAAEARLVAHQHACIEALDAITGAVAARAHEWPRVGA